MWKNVWTSEFSKSENRRNQKVVGEKHFWKNVSLNPETKKLRVTRGSKKKLWPETWLRCHVAECVEYDVKVNFAKVKSAYPKELSTGKKNWANELSESENRRTQKAVWEKSFWKMLNSRNQKRNGIPGVLEKKLWLKLDRAM